MATENAKINTRIQLKHDTKGNWEKATNFIPKPGEVIIYDADGVDDVRIKIGDGIKKVNELSFFNHIESYEDLAFDTNEIVFDTSASTTSMLGQAILGRMILA